MTAGSRSPWVRRRARVRLRRLRRLERPGGAPPPARAPAGAVAGLAPALDLLQACLTAGSPVVDALEETGLAAEGELGALLRGVALRLRGGAPTRVAWEAALGGDPPAGVGALARACVLSERGGTPLDAVLARLAADERAAAGVRRLAAAHRVGVLAVLPLGLCFLPAYLLLGVVPAVAGLAARFA